jgi:hypothetical protein
LTSVSQMFLWKALRGIAHALHVLPQRLLGLHTCIRTTGLCRGSSGGSFEHNTLTHPLPQQTTFCFSPTVMGKGWAAALVAALAVAWLVCPAGAANEFLATCSSSVTAGGQDTVPQRVLFLNLGADVSSCAGGVQAASTALQVREALFRCTCPSGCAPSRAAQPALPAVHPFNRG